MFDALVEWFFAVLVALMSISVIFMVIGLLVFVWAEQTRHVAIVVTAAAGALWVFTIGSVSRLALASDRAWAAANRVNA